ncbi:hypothetical protein KIPB_016054, partial [Kipferlia bialata]|eukprot:g16054.t1
MDVDGIGPPSGAVCGSPSAGSAARLGITPSHLIRSHLPSGLWDVRFPSLYALVCAMTDASGLKWHLA